MSSHEPVENEVGYTILINVNDGGNIHVHVNDGAVVNINSGTFGDSGPTDPPPPPGVSG